MCNQYLDCGIGETWVGIGNTSGRKIDKFRAFDLTPKPARQVKTPPIDACYANLACKVVDSKLVAKYDFFILEVINAWIDSPRKDPHTIHHREKGMFMVNRETIKLPSRMK